MGGAPGGRGASVARPVAPALVRDSHGNLTTQDVIDRQREADARMRAEDIAATETARHRAQQAPLMTPGAFGGGSGAPAAEPSYSAVWAREDAARGDQRAYEDRVRASQWAREDAQAEARRRQMADLMPKLDFSPPGGGGGATVPRPVVAGEAPSGVSMPPADPTVGAQAEAAVFGRAKDKVGQSLRGLMKSLEHRMASRGITGSGIEGAETADILSGGLGQLADVATTQAQSAVTGLRHREDAERAAALTRQGYDVTQRGQDISRQAQQNEAIMRLMQMISAGAY